MNTFSTTLWATVLVASSACSLPEPKQPSPAPPRAAIATPRDQVRAPTSRQAKGGATKLAGAPSSATSCGPLDCRLYNTVQDGLAPLLDTEVQVIAFGEAHAQQGTEHIPSTARRFAEGILPMFAGRSSDLVLELMIPNPECQKAEAKVVQKQEEVTRPQAPSNQDEYVALAQRAKDLGIRPHVLRPSCEQYDRILAAGENDISVMLEMIAELTAQKVKALLGLSAIRGSKGLVLTYGGLLHNDMVPREGRESWTFGPELRDSTGGRYVAVDLIVREYVKDTSVWRTLPWYQHFDGSRHPDKAVAFVPTQGELTLIYPWSTVDKGGAPPVVAAPSTSATPSPSAE